MEKNLEFIGEQLKKLTAIPSPSSYTEKAAEYLMETLKESRSFPIREMCS